MELVPSVLVCVLGQSQMLSYQSWYVAPTHFLINTILVYRSNLIQCNHHAILKNEQREYHALVWRYIVKQ